MKNIQHHLLIIFALLLYSACVGHATEPGVAILDDHQLSAVRGGWCPFEECEAAPGNGVCQPIPATTAALCAVTSCKYSQSEAGGVDVLSCNFAGKYTCSVMANYRECVLAFKLSTCSNGKVPTCGVIVEPFCNLDIKDRTCVCGSGPIATPCDWTDCSS